MGAVCENYEKILIMQGLWTAGLALAVIDLYMYGSDNRHQNCISMFRGHADLLRRWR